jgi:hypothetical protein
MVARGLTQIGKTAGYGLKKIINTLMKRCYIFKKTEMCCCVSRRPVIGSRTLLTQTYEVLSKNS